MHLKSLIQEAYDKRSWQVTGPAWMEDEQYEVIATMPAETSRDIARLMLQRLLAERFGLQFHRDDKEVPVYELVPDKGGTKLEAVPGSPRYSPGRGRITATAISMRVFTDLLSGIAEKPVIDKTGMEGTYKFDLRWTPDYRGEPGDVHPRDAAVPDAVRQLGLRLQPAKARVEILVVDHASRIPAPN
jgi:uncharacterized protein (TIGR03435 family)